MTDELMVVLDGELAGTIARTRSGGRTTLELRYDDEYRTSEGAVPLSLSMQLAVPSHPGRSITAWLQGLLPDDPEVLRRWGSLFDVSPNSPFDLLSTPVGEDCSGAASFVTPDRLDAFLSTPGGVEWLDDAGLASRLRALRADRTAWLGPDFEGHFSLAGAQAKVALLHRDGRWGVPHGDVPTTHILKPAIPGLDHHDLNEHLCLAAAAACGLRTAHSKIISVEDQQAIAVTRYDRMVDDDGVRMRRVHQEDFCQALSIEPRLKYQNEGGPSSTAVSRLIRESVGPDLAVQEAGRFADALIFNWVIAGTDAHAKNYSLLLVGGGVRLAPLYDLGSALPYGTHIRKLRLAMKFGGSYGLLPGSHRLCEKVAGELGLAADDIEQRMIRICEAAPDGFSDAAAKPAITSLGAALPALLVDEVSARARECRRWL